MTAQTGGKEESMSEQERDKQWADEVIYYLGQLYPEQQQAALATLRLLAGASQASGTTSRG